MTPLSPFATLFEAGEEQERPLPLPQRLADLFGEVRIPQIAARPWVVTNFVSTLDGVVSLSEPGHSGGGDISGSNQHDQAFMGLLRAAADAVIVGAGQLRAPPGTLWLPQTIYPALAEEYAGLRQRLDLPANPLQVVVTASGGIDPALPIFQTPGLQVLILTSREGYRRLAQASFSGQVVLKTADEAGRISPEVILAEIERIQPLRLALIEGGPGLANDFLTARLLDELFSTISPQVAGRTDKTTRPGFVQGTSFAPYDPRWSRLVAARQAGSHLFLRYRFTPTTE